MLTKKQKNLLSYIKKFIDKNDYSPSIEEIAKYFKLANSTVHEHLENLKKKNYLNKKDYQIRGIEISEKENLVRIPLLGTITAGQPIEAIEVSGETISIP